MKPEYFSKIGDAVLKVSLSVCLLGIAFIFVQGEERNYAYLDHQGGFTALGYIDRQTAYVDAELIGVDGSTLASGLSSVRRFLRNVPDGKTFNQGVILNADAGLSWIASERNHKLTIHQLELESDGSNDVVLDWLNQLDGLESRNILNYKTHAESALRYEKAPPSESSILNDIGRFLRRWSD